MSPGVSPRQHGAPDAEVLEVGAGPTGLLLAGDLARAAVDVTILERRDHESNPSRAFSHPPWGLGRRASAAVH
ncbi:FAD-dependent monooxygenase [Streptomyces sp. NPDC094153]